VTLQPGRQTDRYLIIFAGNASESSNSLQLHVSLHLAQLGFVQHECLDTSCMQDIVLGVSGNVTGAWEGNVDFGR
jgi:hypothetical protein